MDSDNASTTPPVGKIHRCSCGRRMSSLQHDFRSICVVCRGVDFDTNHRCPKCKDFSYLLMANYVKYKISLQHKLQSKYKLKDPLRLMLPILQPISIPSVTSVSKMSPRSCLGLRVRF